MSSHEMKLTVITSFIKSRLTQLLCLVPTSCLLCFKFPSSGRRGVFVCPTWLHTLLQALFHYPKKETDCFLFNFECSSVDKSSLRHLKPVCCFFKGPVNLSPIDQWPEHLNAASSVGRGNTLSPCMQDLRQHTAQCSFLAGIDWRCSG